MGVILILVGVLLVCVRVIYFSLTGKPVDKEEKQVFITTCGVLFCFVALMAGAYYLSKQLYFTNTLTRGAILIIYMVAIFFISELIFFRNGVRNDRQS